MKGFADMIIAVGKTNSTLEKQALLSQYFSNADDTDKLWAIALFSGKKPTKKIKSSALKTWCIEYCNIPEWLFEESYQHVGDLAETIALLLPPPAALESGSAASLSEIMQLMYDQSTFDEISKKQFITYHWEKLEPGACFVFNKLMTGGFRIGVSQQTMIQAIAKATQQQPEEVAYRIMGDIDPIRDKYSDIILHPSKPNDSKPYPFYLCYPLENELHETEDVKDWTAEWKWDGIRGQCIKRNNQYFIWSRGETLITDALPEFKNCMQSLPDGTVLDGEILCGNNIDGNIQPLPFSLLQTRLNRKKVTLKQLQHAPALFIAYDMLEYNGEDMRQRPLSERKILLDKLIQEINCNILIASPDITFNTWDELSVIRKKAREKHTEGLMLKKKDGIYMSGRKKGEWWKWKLDPLTIDCVLIYAQKGHGRRSGMYTDYTFAVKDGDKLVSFTKAYSGLTDSEFREVDAYIKQHALEKFGPVRTVKPELVFEISFEGISESKRHKSGIALRFPRMKRLRRDKTTDEINTLADLKKILSQYNNTDV